MSHETWVVNASPLIVLAKVGQLALLERPGHGLLIPEAVRDEVRAGGALDPARVALDAGFGGAAIATIPDPEKPDGHARSRSRLCPGSLQPSPVV